MSARAIQDAIKVHVSGALPGRAWAMPNVPEPGTVPRYEYALAAADRDKPSLNDDFVQERGRAQLTAVVGAGDAETVALDMADALVSAMPDGLWLNFPGGRLRIMGPATVRSGYRDGPEWRVPVLVRYTAYLP